VGHFRRRAITTDHHAAAYLSHGSHFRLTYATLAHVFIGLKPVRYVDGGPPAERVRSRSDGEEKRYQRISRVSNEERLAEARPLWQHEYAQSLKASIRQRPRSPEARPTRLRRPWRITVPAAGCGPVWGRERASARRQRADAPSSVTTGRLRPADGRSGTAVARGAREAARRRTLQPSAALSAPSTSTLRRSSCAGGVKDLAGNCAWQRTDSWSSRPARRQRRPPTRGEHRAGCGCDQMWCLGD
jgi:hypothetical protein